MSEKRSVYQIGVDMAKKGTKSKTIHTPISALCAEFMVDMKIAERKDDLIKQATLSILNDLDDIDKQAVVMWGNPLHPNVIQIKTMTKAMRDEIEKMIYDEIKGVTNASRKS